MKIILHFLWDVLWRTISTIFAILLLLSLVMLGKGEIIKTIGNAFYADVIKSKIGWNK